MDALEKAANDGVWEADWSQVQEEVLSRLDKIFRDEFPPPTEPPRRQHMAQEPPQSPVVATSSQGSSGSNKENAPILSSTPEPEPTSASHIAHVDDMDEDLPEHYPREIFALRKSILTRIETGFTDYPPHTLQRLAELVLYPKKHYKFLPSYLRALDRVVSVQSDTRIFPLPSAGPIESETVLNGATGLQVRPVPELGSDEALGGALLTPIPWLVNRESQHSSGSEKELQTSSTEIVDGPNGAGRIETVNVVNGIMSTVSHQPAQGLSQETSTTEALRADGAVTQGELLRQEQEAGVVAVPPRGLRLSDEEMEDIGAGSEATDGTEDEEKPHARGPDEIGDEDIGPQPDRPAGGALDLEAAVGRKRETSTDPEDASLSDAGT